MAQTDRFQAGISGAGQRSLRPARRALRLLITVLLAAILAVGASYALRTLNL